MIVCDVRDFQSALKMEIYDLRRSTAAAVKFTTKHVVLLRTTYLVTTVRLASLSKCSSLFLHKKVLHVPHRTTLRNSETNNSSRKCISSFSTNFNHDFTTVPDVNDLRHTSRVTHFRCDYRLFLLVYVPTNFSSEEKRRPWHLHINT